MGCVLAGVLLASSPASASGDALTITPGYGCPTESYCTVDFSSGGVVLNDDSGLVTLTLVNLATGAAVPGISGNKLLGPLPAGTYLLTAQDDDEGRWLCSVHNPDGCTWISGTPGTYRWKFVYSGAGSMNVPLWVAPSMKVEKPLMRPAFKTKRHKVIARGRIAATVETATFGLADASGHRKVELYRRPYKGGHWKRVARTHSRPNGTFKLKAVNPGMGYWWRIEVTRRGASPAYVGSAHMF